MNKKTLFIIICFCIIAFCSLFDKYTNIPYIPVITRDTITLRDTIWRDTTIVEEKLLPSKTDTLYLDTLKKDTVLPIESKTFEKSIINESDTVDATIYVSGIKPSLDSISMRFKTHSEVITNTIEVTKYVERKQTFKDRFVISPQVGVGYGLINKKADLYVGVGVGVKLWK